MWSRTLLAAAMLGALCAPMALGQVPQWARSEGIKWFGKNLEIVCQGTGPSVDIARREALGGCRASASSQINSDVHVKSLSIETEKDVGYHQQVTSDAVVRDLRCNPINEDIQERDGSFTVWTKCRFDTALTKVENNIAGAPPKAPSDAEDTTTKLSSKGDVDVGKIIEGEEIEIYLSTVPSCSSILFNGPRSRIKNCDSNPIRLLLRPDDQSVVIRAKGHVPKTLQSSVLLKKKSETVQVFLDPL